MINAELSQKKNSEQRFASFGTEGTQSQASATYIAAFILHAINVSHPSSFQPKKNKTVGILYEIKRTLKCGTFSDNHKISTEGK